MNADARQSLFAWILRGQRAVVLLLAMLIIADLLFIVLHVVAVLRGPEAVTNLWLYRINGERGYAEFFQYMKLVYLCVLILFYAWSQRSWQMAAWVPLFGYFLLDDALQLHERFGARFVRELGLESALGLRGQDFGELLVSLLAGGILVIPLILGYLRGRATVRWVYRAMALMVGIFLFFGIVVDMLHSAVLPMLPGFDWMTLIEDGGEMVALSLVVAFALRLNVGGGGAGLVLDTAAELPRLSFRRAGG